MKKQINRRTRLTAWLLTLAMVFAMIPVVALPAAGAANETVEQESVAVNIETVSPGKSVTLNVDSTDGYYIISTADELDAFSALVRTNGQVYAKLTANITYNTGDLSTLAGKTDGYREYMPAGMTEVMSPTYSKSFNVFTGILDGQGYTISGLYYSKGHSSGLEGYGGLVSKLGNGGVIKNLTIEKSYFADVSMVGAFAGDMASGSLIENCHNVGTTVRGGRYVGGIAGFVENGTVKGCTNSGKVENYLVNNAINPVKTAGGIAGYVKGSSGLVELCSNSGTVSATANGGGIAGEAWDGGTVQNCLNKGTVNSPEANNVGGIAGYVYEGNIHNNLCVGTVIGYGTVGHMIGGIGEVNSYSNNYHCHTITVTREDVKTVWDDSKVTAVDSDALASGEVAYLLGSAWGQSIGTENTPVPGGAKVYYGYVSCAEDAVMVYTDTNAPEEKPHILTYTASGTTITESCSAGCGHTATATISAEGTTYTGSAQEKASVAYSDGWLGGELTVSYAGNTDAGTATASVTVGGATVSVYFDIAQATPAYNPPTGEVEATYGDSLEGILNKNQDWLGTPRDKDEMSLAGHWELVDFSETVGDAGIRSFKVRFVPDDKNYGTVEIDLDVNVSPKDATAAMVTLKEAEYVYDGTSKTPIVVVMFDGVTLIEGIDFEVFYRENLNAGEASADVFFMGNYSGEETASFTIKKATPTYTAPTSLTATYGDTLADVELPEGFSWKDADASVGNAGSNLHVAIFTPEDTDNYNTVECELEITVEKKYVDVFAVSLEVDQYVYDGTAKTPIVAVMVDDVPLIKGIDFEVSYSENLNAGKAFVTVTFKDNYSGEVTRSYTITKAIPTVSAPRPRVLTYDGSAQELVVAGTTTGGTMEYSLDGETWSSTIPKATHAGTYKVYYRVIGNQNFEDVDTGDFVEAEILPMIAAEATVTLSKTAYEYDGTAKTPAATVTLDGVALQKDTDYEISYSDNIRVGTVTVTISFKGNYTGTANATFEITCEHSETELQLVAPGILEVCTKCSTPTGDIMIMGNPTATYNGMMHGPYLWTEGTLAGAAYTLSYVDENGQPVEAMIDAGTYTVTLTYEGLSLSCEMTVYPAWVLITVDNAVKTYGDADPVYTYTYEMVMGAIPEGDDMGVFFTREEGEDVGTYTLTPRVSNPNYKLLSIDDAPSATLTVVPRVAELVWVNTSLEYNGGTQAPTALVGNLVGDDACTVTVQGNGKYEGTFAATAVALDSPNYVLPENVTTEYTILADPYKVVGDFIPESVKLAVREAVSEAVSEVVSEVVSELGTVLENTLENAFNSLVKDLKGRLSKVFG